MERDQRSGTALKSCPNHYCVGGWVPWEPNESQAAPPIACRHPDCPHKEREAEPQSWVERVTKAFGGYRREKSRDPAEARLLRERGTPEHLIGPTDPSKVAANRGGDRMDTWADVG